MSIWRSEISDYYRLAVGRGFLGEQVRKWEKQEIIESAMKEDPFDDKKAKIDNFCFFFDRFWIDVEAIISQYDFELQKICVPEATRYFKL